MGDAINIKNRKASFNYELLDKYVAGIQLTGTEIKSIRAGKASIAEAYCFFKDGELYVKNMHIDEYTHGSYANHEPRRDRKLLMHKNELSKLEDALDTKGITIIPLRLFVNDKGYAKLAIATGKGKKQYDKRESIKQKDAKRQMDRMMKKYK